MGKKSKRGVVKAGAKPRPAAGQGGKRSGSISEDGRSVASQDDHKSFNSGPIGVKPVVAVPPGNVTIPLPTQPTTNGGDKNSKDTSVHASIPITTAPAPAAKAPVPAAKAPVPAAKAPVPAAKVPAPSVNAPALVVNEPAPAVKKPEAKAETDTNGVWSGNLRDAVKADAEGPAVLDVTMDEDPPAEPKVSALAASVAEPVVQSRGFSLTEPAPKEAKNKKEECHCAIL
jgi:hypothetical protein